MVSANMAATSTSTWVTSALLGVAFHAFTQMWELDLLVPQTLGGLSAAALAAFYVDVQVFHSAVADAATNLAIAAFGFVLSLTASTFIYRVFFHRLRKFPGPFAAKTTKLYSIYLSRNLQYHFEIEKLHKKYGDVVRTGKFEPHPLLNVGEAYTSRSARVIRCADFAAESAYYLQEILLVLHVRERQGKGRLFFYPRRRGSPQAKKTVGNVNDNPT